MAFQSILVHLTSDKSCLQRLNFASKLTDPAQRRIHGCYYQSETVPAEQHMPELMMAPEGIAWVPEVQKNAKTLIKDDIYATRKTMGESTLKGEIQWHTAQGDLLNNFTESAIYHDLAVLSKQYFDGFNDVSLKFALPDLNQTLPCPLYILSDNVLPDYFPTNPMVVWDGSVETARALKQALPLLKAAGRVSLLSCIEGSDERDIVMAEQVADLLQTHGIRINTLHGANASLPLAEAVTETVTHHRHDLVVLGYSGDSILQKLTDTRLLDQIMDSVNVPLFVSN